MGITALLESAQSVVIGVEDLGEAVLFSSAQCRGRPMRVLRCEGHPMRENRSKPGETVLVFDQIPAALPEAGNGGAW